MIERRPRRSWRAGYLIVPLALGVGLLQFLIPSQPVLVGWLGDPHQQASTPQAPASEAPAPAERPMVASPELPEAEPAVDPPRVQSAPPEPSPGKTPIRVFIHEPAGGGAVPAIQLAAYLQTHGFEVADIRLVPFAIERPSVRFFFDRDRPETRRLVQAVRAFFANDPERAPQQATDFSHFSPKPRQGNVEVWLPAHGQSQAGRASSAS